MNENDSVIQKAYKKLGLSKQHLSSIFNDNELKDRELQIDALALINSICPHRIGASCFTVRIDDKNLFDVLSEIPISLIEVERIVREINNRIEHGYENKSQVSEIEEFLLRPNVGQY
jgi:hypothetical protein